VKTVGVPWFRRDDYNRVRDVMVDAHALPASFDVWLIHAENMWQEILRLGAVPIRIHIDVDRFLAWCKHRNTRPDCSARKTFASEIAQTLGGARECLDHQP